MTTALYRRYRPETFADVIGQEHVTDPLRQALRSDRITHAYLFSGPRGCGKTTSARILARCLNCVEGPTDTPCGVCDSCVELARDGSGSLDVVEIDAASHNGVDDARELRERALFAPARDRYKIFILDEAHMVTSQGFNALLKLVEEPPPHVKFVFATTEPEKVIGTIRSRTHHYPFRLVPPEALINYLETLAEKEGVSVGAGVLPLVVRAGGGSVRDTLSVMDQLMAGAGDSGVDYELAATLLGYTPDSLLDDVVSAIAARDGAGVFQIVDRIIESGHDPRRFVEDLLERLRDLVVIAAAGEHAEAIMRGVPADQLSRMRSQSALFTPSDLSQAADTTNTALSEMTGATSPRLHLELLCARLLLISAPSTATPQSAAPASSRPTVAAPEAARPAASDAEVPTPEKSTPAKSAPETAAPAKSAPDSASATSASESPASATAAPAARAAETRAPEVPAPAQRSGGVDANLLRQRWPEVLETLGRLRRVTWVLVSQNAQVVDVTDTTVRLGFTTQALANTFANGPHTDYVREAIAQTLGATLSVEPVLGGANAGASNAGAGGANSGGPGESNYSNHGGSRGGAGGSGSSGSGSNSSGSNSSTSTSGPRDSRPTSWDSPPPNPGATAPSWDPQPDEHEEVEAKPNRPWERAAATSEIDENGESLPDNVRHLPTATPAPVGAEFEESSEDDEILENSDSVGIPLVQREMGGEIIEEIEE